MTQQYQHIEPDAAVSMEAVQSGHWTILKTSPRLLELLNKSVVKPVRAKHPLLRAPYVKE